MKEFIPNKSKLHPSGSLSKYFTFDNKRPGYDHAISADYEGIRRIVTQIRRVEKALGEEYKKPIESESKARIHARRSLVAALDIPKNTVITREMIGIKRPGTGIESKFLDMVLGRKAKKYCSRHCSAMGYDLRINIKD